MRKLAKRQWEVATLRVEGLSIKEIAGRLGISEATVKSTLAIVYNKLNVDNVAQLVKAMETYDGTDQVVH